jgi:hypothetical protein
MRIAALAAAGLSLFALSASAQDSRVWSLDVGKTETYLRFAEPDSDDQPLSLHCTRKTGQIVVRFDVEHRLADRLQGEDWVDRLGRPAPWPVSVTLSSTTARTTLPGGAHADQLNGGSSIQVEVTDRAPVMREFAKSGVLRASALEDTVETPPAPRAMASRLLQTCKQ